MHADSIADSPYVRPVSMTPSRHDRHAPYWAAALAVLGGIGLSTTWIDRGHFWNGYVLDMTGPAWNYILFRGRFTTKTDNAWTRFFTPRRTAALFVVTCFAIEAAQYLGLYDATFDPWDLLAYVSLLVPLMLIDLATSEDGRADEVTSAYD
jgi:hypothetical protein